MILMFGAYKFKNKTNGSRKSVQSANPTKYSISEHKNIKESFLIHVMHPIEIHTQ